MTRSYLDTPVSSKELDAIIRAAHCAPSAGNTRSMELLVLGSDDVAAYWDVTLPQEKRSSFPWPGLLRAPVLLVPYVDPQAYVERYSEPDKAKTGLGDAQDSWSVPYWWVDGGAATQNILIAASALGLGACLFGQFEHEPAVRKRFGVPSGRRAIATIAIGHPDAANERPSGSAKRTRRPNADVTHYGQWD